MCFQILFRECSVAIRSDSAVVLRCLKSAISWKTRTMGDAVKRKKVGWGVCLREECLFAGGSVTIDSFQGICIDEGYLIMYYPDDWSIILIEDLAKNGPGICERGWNHKRYARVDSIKLKTMSREMRNVCSRDKSRRDSANVGGSLRRNILRSRIRVIDNEYAEDKGPLYD